MANRRSPVTNPAVKTAAPAASQAASAVGKPPSGAADRSPVQQPAKAAPSAARAVSARAQVSPIHAPVGRNKPKPSTHAPVIQTPGAAAAKVEPADTPGARLAKAAMRRLAMDKIEPTPDNYARAYQQEAGAEGAPVLSDRAQKLVEKLSGRAFAGHKGNVAGDVTKALSEGRWDVADRLINTPDDGGAPWADLMDRIVRGLERGGKQWTSARKKDSLQRVLGGSRSDAAKLQQRLAHLLASWETDKPWDPAENAEEAGASPVAPAPVVTPFVAASPHTPAPAVAQSARMEDVDVMGRVLSAPDELEDFIPAWKLSVTALGSSVEGALPVAEVNSQRLAQAIHDATRRIQREGISHALADEVSTLCGQANRVIQHRHHLVDQLGGLCRELTVSLTDLSENNSWVQGQCDAMHELLGNGLTARGVKAVTELLHHTRGHQSRIREDRERARDSLKGLINQMLSELSELGTHTGRFHESVGRYADVIEKADSLESLAGVVREMVEESRAVQSLVQQTQDRLHAEHSNADELNKRVIELEHELRRLAQEVSTDQLTQIANRRGLLASFDIERARLEREGGSLCIGLLDIDNFKRLNDELGHSAGDEALKALAAVVSKTLRPTDMVARYGGEEFVVLLPGTPVDEAQQILTRLQRSLSGGLFMHDEKQVFVTFSAGVSAYCLDERIEDTLERADQALYEAKRTGKNRTCVG